MDNDAILGPIEGAPAISVMKTRDYMISAHNVLLYFAVCTLIDNDTRHHSGQNLVDSGGAAERVHNKF